MEGLYVGEDVLDVPHLGGKLRLGAAFGHRFVFEIFVLAVFELGELVQSVERRFLRFLDEVI